mmetsp:Transcript_24096/g.63682  ORF Transcript_24096/g.63682 Transcript_24096/m.63682 type:complete len:165 (-) Transcript_24096:187-681(-)
MHNRVRQDDIGLEKKFVVRDWATRVNSALLAMTVTNAYPFYRGSVSGDGAMSPGAWIKVLCSEMIFNNWERMGTRSGGGGGSAVRAAPLREFPSSGVSGRLSPTRKVRKENPNAAFRKRCVVCSTQRSRFVCSVCRDAGSELFLCHGSTGRDCFNQHLVEIHGS